MENRTLIIVPAYNEEQALPATLAELTRIFPPRNILVVNDGSADGTGAAAKKAGVRVVNLPVNMGIGVAMQTGYKFAVRHGYSAAVQCDGDGQHPADQIPQLLAGLARGNNLAVGSRFIDADGKGFKSLFVRRQAIRYFSHLIALLTGQRVRDVTSGFRAADRKTMDIFAADYPFDYPEPEALVLLARHGCRIAEVPVVMRERQGGVSSIGLFAGVYYVVKVSIGLFVQRLRK